jgi:hypothetical protein
MYDRFFPNYMVANRIIIEQPRPLAAANRYDALLPWLQAHQDLFFSKAQATVTLNTLALYVTEPQLNLLDLSSIFAKSKPFFQRVGFRQDILHHRKTYIEALADIGSRVPPAAPLAAPAAPPAARLPLLATLPPAPPPLLGTLSPADAGLISENLDPKYFLKPATTLDFLVLDFPAAILNKFSVVNDIPIAMAPPVPAAPPAAAAPSPDAAYAALIGFHDVSPEKGVDYFAEYSVTTTNPPQPEDYIYPNCSVSLGMVKEVGTGVVNIEASTAGGSSGGPFLNSSGEVFAMNMCSFYDAPGRLNPADFTILNHNDVLRVDVVLPESPNYAIAESRNRVLGLSMFHSGVRQLLAHV